MTNTNPKSCANHKDNELRALIGEQISPILNELLAQNREVATAITNQSSQVNDKMDSMQAEVREVKTEVGQIKTQIDTLEQIVAKKATTAGAISGAVAGGITGGLAVACMEFVKLKFGG